MYHLYFSSETQDGGSSIDQDVLKRYKRILSNEERLRSFKEVLFTYFYWEEKSFQETISRFFTGIVKTGRCLLEVWLKW
jgi:hypothetical protein